MNKYEKVLDAMLNRSYSQQGIYFSRVTGKIFEAVKKGKNVKITYTDGTAGPKMSASIFYIQDVVLEYYELLIPYEV